jgi:glycosyltransferase involved in cell wall biosynthesis
MVDRPVTGGGGERMARNIAVGLDPSRFESTLCATRSVSTDVMAELAGRVDGLELGRRSTLDLVRWWPLIAYLRSRRIDILHTHKFGSNVWGAPIGRLARVPVVIAHEHSWTYLGHPLRRCLDREVVARAADVVIAVSREDRRKMIDVEHLDPERVRFIPNGIRRPKPGRPHVVRRELGIPKDAKVVGAVGSLRPQKALGRLVVAAEALISDFPDLRVLIVGDGEQHDAIREEVKRRGLGDHVLLLGYRSDVQDVLAAIDVCVSTSQWEGSPLAVMEYMAAGKPIVATSVGGVPDLITDGTHGLLVERDNDQRLADSIRTVLGNPELAARLGASAQHRQAAEFTIEGTVRRVESLYETLFASSARARAEFEAWT